MNVLVALAAALALAVTSIAPLPAAATEKYDGSAPAICATAALMECGAEGRCQRQSAESVNFPALFRVDVKAMKVHNLEADKGRQSPIEGVSHANGKLVLNGADAERGWVVVINEQTGRMSGVVSGDGEAFVIFGQCALP